MKRVLRHSENNHGWSFRVENDNRAYTIFNIGERLTNRTPMQFHQSREILAFLIKSRMGTSECKMASRKGWALLELQSIPVDFRYSIAVRPLAVKTSCESISNLWQNFPKGPSIRLCSQLVSEIGYEETETLYFESIASALEVLRQFALVNSVAVFFKTDKDKPNSVPYQLIIDGLPSFQERAKCCLSHLLHCPESLRHSVSSCVPELWGHKLYICPFNQVVFAPDRSQRLLYNLL